MVKTCCVKNCDIAAKENVTCFRFPNNRFLRRKWIDAIGLSNKLTANSTVCIKHFLRDDYDIVRGRPRLKAKVIPSLFCESDKRSISSYITEDDIISNEINTEITLQSIRKEKLDSLKKNTDLQNESRTKLDKNKSADVENGSSRKSKDKEKTEIQKVCSSESSVKLQDNHSTSDLEKTESLEVSTELQNEGETNTKGQSTAGAKISKENGKELLNDKVQNDDSAKMKTDSSSENKNEKVEKRHKSRKKQRNGLLPKEKKHEKGFQDSFVESTTKSRSTAEDLNKDIEDILVNYQIKQTRPLPAADHLDLDDGKGASADRDQAGAGETRPDDTIDLDKETDPVFIEVAVQGGAGGAGDRDCLMVLESVQVELDPSSFLDHDPDHDHDHDHDDCQETVDLAADDDDHTEHKQRDRRPDPISLLTSSDEDEVIIQEPHIDTVEVSDETDEDDVPLVALLARGAGEPPAAALAAYQYFCMDCRYTAASEREYRAHAAQHSTILQVCEVCDYTTASKSQFSRHRRKHKDDRKFKCHLCEYKARHNMSLIYHLKSHRALSSAKKGFKCDKCGFKSDVKSLVLKHVKLCATDIKKYSCDKCMYETKRPSDLRRHRMRRHNDEPDDDDEFVP